MTSHPETTVNWTDLDRQLNPSFLVKVNDLKGSLSYAWVREAYDHGIPAATAFAEALLGCDPKQRYGGWLQSLVATLRALEAIGVTGYADLVERTGTREGVEALLPRAGVPQGDLGGLVYYLRHWVIPSQRPLRTFIDPDDVEAKERVRRLKVAGLYDNLQLLERGRVPAGRARIAAELGIPEPFVTGLVHFADLSRLPFHSRKTVAYLVRRGADTLAALAATDPQLILDRVMAYGRSIGKDLRYGVEPASSAVIARVLPRVVEG